MARIFVFGDVHDDLSNVKRVLAAAKPYKPDLVLSTGDISSTLPPYAKDQELLQGTIATDAVAMQIINAIGQHLPNIPFAFVPGNHDPKRFHQAEPYNLDGKIGTLSGIAVTGIGGAGPACHGWPYEWTEADLHTRLGHLLVDGTQIGVLLSHAPPLMQGKNSLDRTAYSVNVGSTVLARLVSKHRGLFLCGHIHESHNVLKLHDQCVGINCGSLGSRYARCRLIIIDFDLPNLDVYVEDLEDGTSSTFNFVV